jgi:hypothetical protein
MSQSIKKQSHHPSGADVGTVMYYERFNATQGIFQVPA